MLQLSHTKTSDLAASGAQGADDAAEIVRRLFVVLKRDIRLVLGVFLTVVVLVGLLVFSLKPSYTGTTTLLIDPRATGVFSAQQVTMQIGPADPAIIDSQVEILKSDHLERAVIKSLDLTQNPEFLGEEEWFEILIGKLKALNPFRSPSSEASVMETVLANFDKRLKVERDQQTFLVNVSFQSHSPEKAAKIANAVAEAYLTDRLQARFDSAQLATEWLSNRVEELREKALQSDARLEKYKSDKGIVLATGQLLNEQELTAANLAVSAARGAVADAQARYDRIKAVVDSGDVDGAVTSEVQSSPAIQKLRSDLGELLRREVDLAKRVEPGNEARKRLQEQITQIRSMIVAEYARVLDAARSDLDVAKSREEAANDKLRLLTQRATEVNANQVAAREMEREATTKRQIYESFLQKYTETTQQSGVPITETRIVSRAVPPTLPSAPKRALLLAAAAGGGLALGIGIVLLRDRFAPGIRSRSELEAAANMHCLGLIPVVHALATSRQPALTGAHDVREGRVLTRPHGILGFALSHPFSPMAEVIRNVKLAVQSQLSPAEVRVIGVTSAVSGEGKSTIAANLALYLANSGYKVLLVDSDVRRPDLTRKLVADNVFGLREAVESGLPVAEMAYTDPVTGLKFLPSIDLRESIVHADIVSSPAFHEALKEWRSVFDYVIVDCAPVLAVSDVHAMGPSIDAFVLVTAWGVTSRATLEYVARLSSSFRTKYAGVVLNKVPAEEITHYTPYNDIMEKLT